MFIKNLTFFSIALALLAACGTDDTLPRVDDDSSSSDTSTGSGSADTATDTGGSPDTTADTADDDTSGSADTTADTTADTDDTTADTAPDSSAACVSNADCPSFEACIAGACAGCPAIVCDPCSDGSSASLLPHCGGCSCDAAPACASDADCSLGLSCVTDPATGIASCQSAGACGPSPAGCTTTGCGFAEICDTHVGCAPSGCSCDSATGSWSCTDDCGGGTCVAGGEIGDLCASNADCLGGLVCDLYDLTCRPACAVDCLVYDPVCGTDGITYVCGAVDAECNGVAVAYAGECGGSGGGTVGDACTTDTDCEIGIVCYRGTCDFLLCPLTYIPVCGADGITYANDCLVRAGHTSIAYAGECVSGGAEGDPCAADSECATGLVCESGSCGIILCPRIYAPVCGSDGVTYSNDCEARVAHAAVAYTGACDTRATGCYTDADCAAGTLCSAATECLPDPSCPACSVCYGYCR